MSSLLNNVFSSIKIRSFSPTRKLLPTTSPSMQFSRNSKSVKKFSRIKNYALVGAAATVGVTCGLHIFDYLHHPSENLRQRFNFIDKVVQHCSSSVVYVEIREPSKLDVENDQPLTSSNGSGFIIGEDGWILTNAHVVVNKPDSVVLVMLADGTKYEATIEDADMNIDLALLKINPVRKLPYLRFGESNKVTTGEWVVALGSPLSLSHSVTAGVISSVSREAEDLGLRNFSMKYIQTDAAITFGNSGGPLVNLDGEVVGINNLRVTAGIAFAIPIDYAKMFLDQSRFSNKPNVVNSHREEKRSLGITTISINSDVVNVLHNVNRKVEEDVRHGVLVWDVLSGMLGNQSGIEVGDIITHVNGSPVHEASDIYNIEPQTDKLKIEVVRRGKRKAIFINN